MSEVKTERRLTMTVEEAAAILGISRGGAYELARRNELPGAIRLGGRSSSAARSSSARSTARRPTDEPASCCESAGRCAAPTGSRGREPQVRRGGEASSGGRSTSARTSCGRRRNVTSLRRSATVTSRSPQRVLRPAYGVSVEWEPLRSRLSGAELAAELEATIVPLRAEVKTLEAREDGAFGMNRVDVQWANVRRDLGAGREAVTRARAPASRHESPEFAGGRSADRNAGSDRTDVALGGPAHLRLTVDGVATPVHRERLVAQEPGRRAARRSAEGPENGWLPGAPFRRPVATRLGRLTTTAGHPHERRKRPRRDRERPAGVTESVGLGSGTQTAGARYRRPRCPSSAAGNGWPPYPVPAGTARSAVFTIGDATSSTTRSTRRTAATTRPWKFGALHSCARPGSTSRRQRPPARSATAERRRVIWTDADAAELDVLVHALTFDFWEHRKRVRGVPARAVPAARGVARPQGRTAASARGSRRSRSAGTARGANGGSSSTATACAVHRARTCRPRSPRCSSGAKPGSCSPALKRSAQKPTSARRDRLPDRRRRPTRRTRPRPDTVALEELIVDQALAADRREVEDHEVVGDARARDLDRDRNAGVRLRRSPGARPGGAT